jgi:hypothetical protein
VVPAVGHPVVVRLSQVERADPDQAGGDGEGMEGSSQRAVDVPVPGVRPRDHVVDALPHLVERVLTEGATPSKKGGVRHHTTGDL